MFSQITVNIVRDYNIEHLMDNEILKNQEDAKFYKELSNGLQLACDELREKAKKWFEAGDKNKGWLCKSTRWSRIRR